jgi:hypothetical protein
MRTGPEHGWYTMRVVTPLGRLFDTGYRVHFPPGVIATARYLRENGYHVQTHRVFRKPFTVRAVNWMRRRPVTVGTVAGTVTGTIGALLVKVLL